MCDCSDGTGSKTTVLRTLAGVVYNISSSACGAAFLVQSGETNVPLVMCRCSTYGEKITSLRG